MPTAQERLDQITLKLDRASAHIDELQRRIGEFFNTDPIRVLTKRNATDTGIVYYVSHIDPSPPMLAAVVGDAIQCMVTALDHVAWHICCSETNGNPTSPSKIYFPVADNAADYLKNRARKLPGVSPAVLAAFDAVKPYKGGNDEIWQLHELNRTEKHRTLLTVGSTTHGTDIGQFMWNSMKSAPNMPPKLLERMGENTMFRVVLKGDHDGTIPIAVGMELFGDLSGDPPRSDFKFEWGIGLKEPNVVTHLNIVAALRDYQVAVSRVVDDLKGFLKTTP